MKKVETFLSRIESFKKTLTGFVNGRERNVKDFRVDLTKYKKA